MAQKNYVQMHHQSRSQLDCSVLWAKSQLEQIVRVLHQTKSCTYRHFHSPQPYGNLPFGGFSMYASQLLCLALPLHILQVQKTCKPNAENIIPGFNIKPLLSQTLENLYIIVICKKTLPNIIKLNLIALIYYLYQLAASSESSYKLHWDNGLVQVNNIIHSHQQNSTFSCVKFFCVFICILVAPWERLTDSTGDDSLVIDEM